MDNKSGTELYFEFGDADESMGPIWERAAACTIFALLVVFGIAGEAIVIPMF